jgi:hypothetical protein
LPVFALFGATLFDAADFAFDAFDDDDLAFEDLSLAFA